MKDLSIRIDQITMNILEEYKSEINTSKKLLLAQMVQYCYHNSVDFQSKKANNTLKKEIKKITNEIKKEIAALPEIIKKYLDPDDHYHPDLDITQIKVELLLKYINNSDQKNIFLNSLNPSQRNLFSKAI